MRTTCHPHCKINIGLNVVSRRTDGYHNLETIFYPVKLCDELSTAEAEADSLEVDSIRFEGDWQDNLVVRAMEKLRAEGYHVPPQSIRLTKHIPTGAGLGGGSSDAAFMMRMLNEIYSFGLSETQMEGMLSSLGADCPFFAVGSPRFASGIGNVFSPTPLMLNGWQLVLVTPPEHVSTKEAYSHIVPRRPLFSLTEVGSLDVRDWEGKVVNDFEDAVFPFHPAVAAIKEKLYKLGAAYASMSGSGGTVFALFQTPVNELAAAFPGCFTYQETLLR